MLEMLYHHFLLIDNTVDEIAIVFLVKCVKNAMHSAYYMFQQANYSVAQ